MAAWHHFCSEAHHQHHPYFTRWCSASPPNLEVIHLVHEAARSDTSRVPFLSSFAAETETTDTARWQDTVAKKAESDQVGDGCLTDNHSVDGGQLPYCKGWDHQMVPYRASRCPISGRGRKLLPRIDLAEGLDLM